MDRYRCINKIKLDLDIFSGLKPIRLGDDRLINYVINI